MMQQPSFISYGTITSDNVRINGTAHQDALTGEWVLQLTVTGGDCPSCGYTYDTRIPAEDGALGAGMFLRFKVAEWATGFNDQARHYGQDAPDDDDDWSDDWGGNVFVR